jgi:broad specificity phosphatase PhoE
MLKTKITFMRHGHAIDGKVDKIRPLSTKGRLQVKQRALHLKTQPLFDLIITSSAARAIETAQIIMDEIETFAPVVEIDELYQPPNLDDREIVNELLERLGAVPLKIYNNHDTQGAWDRYSASAFNAVFAAIKRQSSKKALVVAHGNIINAIGLQFSKNVSDLNEVYFNYCEGFETYEDKFIFLP